MESSRSVEPIPEELSRRRRQFFLELPNYNKPPPLPTYEELCGATTVEKDINTGPTEFHGNAWVRFYGWLTVVINFTAKLTLSIMTGTRIHAGWVNILYILSACNVWIPFMMNYRRHMTLVRFRFKFLLKTIFPYCLVLEVIIFIGIPLLGYLLYPEKKEVMDWNLFTGLVLSANTVINHLVLINFETHDYKPFRLSQVYLPLAAYEEHGQADKMITVKEWGPFKIVLVNIGTLPIDGQVTVIRMVYGALVHMWLSHAPVHLNLLLEKTWMPGQEITLVPETHFLSGAYHSPRLKSYGDDRGITVETFVYLAEKVTPNSQFCVKRVQVFRRKGKEWNNEVDEAYRGADY